MLDCREKAGFEQIPDEMMGGPIGISFGMEDEVVPLKIAHDLENCMKK